MFCVGQLASPIFCAVILKRFKLSTTFSRVEAQMHVGTYQAKLSYEDAILFYQSVILMPKFKIRLSRQRLLSLQNLLYSLTCIYRCPTSLQFHDSYTDMAPVKVLAPLLDRCQLVKRRKAPRHTYKNKQQHWS